MPFRFPFVLVTLVYACGGSPPPTSRAIPSSGAPSASATALPAITAASIAAPLRFLASDPLEGRLPGTRGSDLAMRYIAAEYEAMGLEPGGDDGTFFQKVPLVGVKTHAPPFIAATSPRGTLKLTLTDDFVVTSGLPKGSTTVDSPDIVFVGYGIVAPEYAWDDYKDADVRGKIVLIMNSDPAGDPALFAGTTRLWYGRWDYKYIQAAKKGAVGAIIIHTAPSAGYPWHVLVTGGERFALASDDEPRVEAPMWATEDASRKLAALGGKDLDLLRKGAESKDFHPASLGVRVAFGLTADVRKLESANVIGKLTGSDASMRAQAVIYSAHHDHLGTVTPEEAKAPRPADSAGPVGSQRDLIYNGAVDNASGVATMIAIARAAASAKRPKRTLAFLAVTAEEQGLLGSKWYCAHPTFAPGRIAADLNLDMMNSFGKTRDVSQVGRGKSSLDRVVDAAALAEGRSVHGDPMPERGMFYRSDQFSFARIGVPGVFLRGSVDFVGRPPGWGKEQIDHFEATRYHQTSDELDTSWDFAGAVDDAELLLRVGLDVANDEAMPAWNAGDEFEAARLRAVAVAR